jgi:hypothetical protein
MADTNAFADHTSYCGLVSFNVVVLMTNTTYTIRRNIINYDFYGALLTIGYIIDCKTSVYGINRNDRIDSTRFHTYLSCLGTLYAQIETSKIDEIIFGYTIS